MEIYKAIDQYSKGEKERIEQHNKAIQEELQKRQKQIDNYMDKLGMDLPKDLVKDIAEKIVELKKEMEQLNEKEPPKDFTKKQIMNWLDHIQNAPGEMAIKLMISKVYANKREVSVESTLTPQILGGDTPVHIIRGVLPEILFTFLSPYK